MNPANETPAVVPAPGAIETPAAATAPILPTSPMSPDIQTGPPPIEFPQPTVAPAVEQVTPAIAPITEAAPYTSAAPSTSLDASGFPVSVAPIAETQPAVAVAPPSETSFAGAFPPLDAQITTGYGPDASQIAQPDTTVPSESAIPTPALTENPFGTTSNLGPDVAKEEGKEKAPTLASPQEILASAQAALGLPEVTANPDFRGVVLKAAENALTQTLVQGKPN